MWGRSLVRFQNNALYGLKRFQTERLIYFSKSDTFHTNMIDINSKLVCKQKSPSSPPLPHDNSLCDNSNPTHILISTHECSYDVSSGVSMLTDFVKGKFPMAKGGIEASTSNRQAVESGAFASEAGGALFLLFGRR